MKASKPPASNDDRPRPSSDLPTAKNPVERRGDTGPSLAWLSGEAGEPSPLFTVLEPAPGGWLRLQRRLKQPTRGALRSPIAWRWASATAALSLLLLAGLWLWLSPSPSSPIVLLLDAEPVSTASQSTAWNGWPQTGPQLELLPERGDSMAAQSVFESDTVLFYWVASFDEQSMVH